MSTGGYGTLEELLEVITWAQLGIHDKPVINITSQLGYSHDFLPTFWSIYIFLQVGLLNVDGYYNSLLSFIDNAVDEGFITPSARHIIVSAHTAQELVSKLEVQLHLFPYRPAP